MSLLKNNLPPTYCIYIMRNVFFFLSFFFLRIHFDILLVNIRNRIPYFVFDANFYVITKIINTHVTCARMLLNLCYNISRKYMNMSNKIYYVVFLYI